MFRVTENWIRILEFRDRKSKELKRQISFSEAVALWMSESMTVSSRRRKRETRHVLTNEYSIYQ